MKRKTYPLSHGANRFGPTTVDVALEVGRLFRQRRLLADGVPVELGTRAFDLRLVLLEADGLLVSKRRQQGSPPELAPHERR